MNAKWTELAQSKVQWHHLRNYKMCLDISKPFAVRIKTCWSLL